VSQLQFEEQQRLNLPPGSRINYDSSASDLSCDLSASDWQRGCSMVMNARDLIQMRALAVIRIFTITESHLLREC
jgi:hypothetical protein